MAYEYDRFEREEGGGSFLMGLLAGTVLGAGLGMLFAPKSGSELRSQLGTQISDSTGRLREVADQGYQQASEKVSQIVDRGREAYDRARGTMAAAGTTGTGTDRTAGGNTGTGATGNLGSTGNIGSTGNYGA
ncbi:MAG TPA: YtxH domain-containing protein [Vicinamibacterales bacterium]|nr:YtxH domain-containing protein [Vicinamibacterales bacterium]